MKKDFLVGVSVPVVLSALALSLFLIGTAEASPQHITTLPSACAGVTVNAGNNLVAMVSNASSGTTFCIASGTFSIGSSAVKPKDNDKLIGASAVVGIDGSIAAASKITGSGPAIIDLGKSSGVTITNLDISGGKGSSSCQPQCGRGISQGDHTTVSYTRVHDNMIAGIGGGGAGVLLSHVELDHNGLSAFYGCCAAGVKSAYAFTVDSSYIHNNTGNGVWQDICGTNLVVTNNTISGNSQSGIRYEHNKACSGSAMFTSNVIKNNNTAGASGAAGISINSAPGAILAYNVFGGNLKFGVAVGGTRGPTTGTSIHDSTLNHDALKGCTLSGVSCTNNI
jgi:Right handed beta helix region